MDSTLAYPLKKIHFHIKPFHQPSHFLGKINTISSTIVQIQILLLTLSPPTHSLLGSKSSLSYISVESMTSLTTTAARETTQMIGTAPFGDQGTISGNLGDDSMVLYDCQGWTNLVGPGAYWPMLGMNSFGQNILLNPNAKEWDPNNNRAPEVDRCLFLTFSNGYPLNQRQIKSFFTRYRNINFHISIFLYCGF